MCSPAVVASDGGYAPIATPIGAWMNPPSERLLEAEKLAPSAVDARLSASWRRFRLKFSADASDLSAIYGRAVRLLIAIGHGVELLESKVADPSSKNGNSSLIR